MHASHVVDFLDALLKSFAATLRVDLALVTRPNVEQDNWTVEALYSSVDEIKEQRIVSGQVLPLMAQAVATELPVVTTDASDCPDALVWLPSSKARCSFMAVPFLEFGTGRTVLACVRTGQGRAFTDGEVERVQEYACGLAGAMAAFRRSDGLACENRALEAKVQEAERMVRDLAHEVKAPAGRMAEFATWIRQDCGHLIGPKANEYLNWICGEAQDLSTLADQTLALAATRSHPTSVEPLDTGLVIRDVRTLLESECRDKGIRVTVLGPLPTVLCQRLHVKQIVENLMSNAIKFMGGQKAPHIIIGTQETVEGRALFVRDNGAGIEASMLERIFLPFQRAHSENVPGAGLGLSIVKALVDQYGGSVTVSSEIGQGSTFVVRLPCAPAAEGSPEERQPTKITFRTARESGIRS